MINVVVWLSVLMGVTTAVFARSEPFLPFEGWYESNGSSAREKVAANHWREIPQNVTMQIVRDGNIVELRLLIDVYEEKEGNMTFLYTIENTMWLVKKQNSPANHEAEKAVLDVLKQDKQSHRFEDRGDGYCTRIDCRYSYTTDRLGEQQRYQSHITWQSKNVGIEFNQTGALSVKRAGEAEWDTFKTWDNTFRSRPPAR